MDETARTIAIIGVILAGLSFLVSVLSLGVSWFVAHRDNARVRIVTSVGFVSGPLPLASPRLDVWDTHGQPLFMIEVINTGRRPVTIQLAGFRYRTTGIWRLIFWEWDRKRPDRSAWLTSNLALPTTLQEQSKITFFSSLADLQRDLGETLKSRHQISGVFADDVTGKRHTARLPRRLWRTLTKDIDFNGGQEQAP